MFYFAREFRNFRASLISWSGCECLTVSFGSTEYIMRLGNEKFYNGYISDLNCVKRRYDLCTTGELAFSYMLVSNSNEKLRADNKYG